MNTISLNQFKAIFGWRDAAALDNTYADAHDRQVINTLNRFRQPHRVLEFGINEGRTAELLLRDSPWIRHYCGIDVFPDFEPAWSHQRPEIPARDAVARFAKWDHRLHTVLSTVGTYEGIATLTGQDYELIYIDADHTYEGVARDTKIALSAAARGACLVWHDYSRDVPGVVKFLDERSTLAGVVHVSGTRVAFEFLAP